MNVQVVRAARLMKRTPRSRKEAVEKAKGLLEFCRQGQVRENGYGIYLLTRGNWWLTSDEIGSTPEELRDFLVRDLKGVLEKLRSMGEIKSDTERIRLMDIQEVLEDGEVTHQAFGTSVEEIEAMEDDYFRNLYLWPQRPAEPSLT